MLQTAAVFTLFRNAVTPEDALRLSQQGLPRPERRARPRAISGARIVSRDETDRMETPVEAIAGAFAQPVEQDVS
jgi:hypothetical protein